MASEVDIINAALSQLGEANILAITDDSRQARLANRTYHDLREDLLREHPWNWATRRASLAASATAPEWGYTRAFPVPSDFLRLVEVNNSSKVDFAVENTADGTVIATDLAAPLEIKYTANITETGSMDPKFRAALSARCAVEWAEPLTARADLRKDAAAFYTQKLREAKAIDGQEDYPNIVASDEWILARY